MMDEDDDDLFKDVDVYCRRLIQQPYNNNTNGDAFTRTHGHEEQEAEEEEEEEELVEEEDDEKVKLMSPRHAEALGTLHSLVDGAAELRVHLSQLGHELEKAAALDSAATNGSTDSSLGVGASPVSSGEAWSELLRLQRGLQRVEQSVQRTTRETERRAVRAVRERERTRRRWEQMKMEDYEDERCDGTKEQVGTNNDNTIGGDHEEHSEIYQREVHSERHMRNEEEGEGEEEERRGTYGDEDHTIRDEDEHAMKNDNSANLVSLMRMRYPSYRVRASSLSSSSFPPAPPADEEDEEQEGDDIQFPGRSMTDVLDGYVREDRVDNHEIHVPRLNASSRFGYDFDAGRSSSSRANLPPSRSYAFQDEANGSDYVTHGDNLHHRGGETTSTTGEATANGHNDKSGANRIKSAIAGGVCVCIAGALRRPGAAVGVLLVVTRAVGRARRRRGRRRGRGFLDVLRGRG